MNRLNNIQVLRAFAALSVAFRHTEYRLPLLPRAGVFGVDIFFVISGFLMASLCERQTAWEFAKRRMVRIIPLYWALTIVIYILAVFAPHLLNTTHAEPMMLVKSLLFIPFFKSAGIIRPLLLVGWTLNLEMLFYALVVIGMVAQRRFAAQIASVLIVCIMLLCKLVGGQGVFAQFYSAPIMLEFIVGIVCYGAYKRISQRRCVQLARVCAFAICACLALFFLMPSIAPIPACVIVMSSLMLSKGGLDYKARAFVLLGDASYALYLIHYYILIGMEKACRNVAPGIDPAHSIVGVLLYLGVTCVVSIGVYVYLEKPVVALLNSRMGQRSRRSQSEVSSSTMPPKDGQPFAA